jgi:hypothetical protein
MKKSIENIISEMAAKSGEERENRRRISIMAKMTKEKRKIVWHMRQHQKSENIGNRNNQNGGNIENIESRNGEKE